MYDYSYVLELLRVHAADQRSRALSGRKAEIMNMTTERTLRNRALAIFQRLQGMAEPKRHQFAERAVRRL
jgi:hypothetical protein